MKLFEILNEIGDGTAKPYKYKKVEQYRKISEPHGEEEYDFTTDSGVKYELNIENNHDYLAIDFTADDSYDKVVNRGEVFRVMATIVDIIKKVVDDNPSILGIRYTPSVKDVGDSTILTNNQRDKLYKIYLKKTIPGIEFIKRGGDVFGIFPKK